MTRPDLTVSTVNRSPLFGYSYTVLAILLLLTAGATYAYHQHSLVLSDQSGVKWTPVVFVIGICVSLVIFALSHREAAARVVLQQKTAALMQAQKQNERLFEAEQRSRIAAEKASRAKDEFLAVMSHELKTPLHAIAGWTRILRMRDISEETRTAAVDKIEKNLRMQTEIIEELLSFSDVVSTVPEHLNRTVVIREVVEEAIEAVQTSAFQKGVALSCDDRLNAVRIVGDRGRLKIALLNVLTNAVKFTPAGGSVEAEAFEDGGCIKCVIRDNGEGIPPEFLPHVFDQYRQSETPSTRHFGGLGLGLTIAKEIVKLHNGSITAESPGPGGGSTFTLTFPTNSQPPQVH